MFIRQRRVNDLNWYTETLSVLEGDVQMEGKYQFLLKVGDLPETRQEGKDS